MDQERVIPGLPCRDLDEVLEFYQALGFEVTYRQQRPNPFAAVVRGGIELHFFAVDGFDPETSMGSVELLVPDTRALFDAFAAGLRSAYGKLPLSGIPRITRPRRRQGAPGGFTVVDPGGNWLRISRLPVVDEADPDDAVDESRLTRVMANAARQADSHGDEQAGVRILQAGLQRHADAPTVQRLPAMVFLAELRYRVGDEDGARSSLAEIADLPLSSDERAAVAGDLQTAAELAEDLGMTSKLRVSDE